MRCISEMMSCIIFLLLPILEKMRLEIVIGMHNEIHIRIRKPRSRSLFIWKFEKRPGTIVSWFRFGFRFAFRWPFRVASSRERAVIVSYIWMGHVANIKQAKRQVKIHEWVTSRIWMSHVSHNWMSRVLYVNESCLILQRGKASSGDEDIWKYMKISINIWMNHVSYMNESCLIYEWVMSYIWMSHVLCMNESCLIYEWVMS